MAAAVGSSSSGGVLGLPASSSSAPAPTKSSSGHHHDQHHQHSHHGAGGGGVYGYEEVVVGLDVAAEEPHLQQKLPIWVGLNCKMVSGISKSTTCQDLLNNIVPASQDPNKYVLVEKWKKMERILDPSVKILKVWKAWGDQIGDVSFVLRAAPTADGYIDKKSSRKVHRKRSSSYHQQKISCHEEDCDKEGHRDAMEQLIKLVITQGEAIQAQLKKLRQQEVQIEKYEEKMHRIRSSQHGENYVVDTYLKDEATKGSRRVKRREKSPCKRDHGNYHSHRQARKEVQVDVHSPQHPQNGAAVCEITSAKKPVSGLTVLPVEEPEEDVDLEEGADLNEDSSEVIKEKTELMENIFQLNVKLTQEEERLVKLGLKIRKLSDKQRKAEWEELALEDISQELEHLKQVTNDQSKEIELNERNLNALEQLLDDKHDHVAFLTHELQLIDDQSEILQRKVLELATLEAAASAAAGSHSRAHYTYEQPQQVFHSHVDPILDINPIYQTSHLQHASATSSCGVPGEERLGYPEQQDSALVVKQGGNRVDPGSYILPHPNNPPVNSSSTRYKCAPAVAPQSSSSHESCSSSCSNSSSSVCVQPFQKAGTTTGSSLPSDPQDNDSNSDTGISSLHSSVDENPMYVLDTLV